MTVPYVWSPPGVNRYRRGKSLPSESSDFEVTSFEFRLLQMEAIPLRTQTGSDMHSGKRTGKCHLSGGIIC